MGFKKDIFIAFQKLSYVFTKQTEYSMNAEIKTAEIRDLDAINQLLRLSKSYWGYDEAFINKFMEKLRITPNHFEKSTIFLLHVDNELAGFYNFLINEGDVLELDNFFIHPNHIGKGLGRKLWDACCKTSKKFGKTEFIIWSDPHAGHFYLRMGCEKIGVRESPVMPNRYPPILRYKI